MLDCRHIILATVLIASFVGIAPAQDADDAVKEKAREVARLMREAASLPAIDLDRFDQAFSVRLADERLTMELLQPFEQTTTRLNLPDVPGLVTVQVFRSPDRRDAAPLGFIVLHRDYSGPGSSVTFTTIRSGAGRINISRETQTESHYSSAELVQDPQMPADQFRTDKPVRLYARRINTRTGEDEGDLRLSADSFVQLMRQHPRECEEFIRPIFRDLRMDWVVFAVDSKVAWQVLGGTVKPAPELVARVDEIVTRLNADDFSVRSRAQEDLSAIGMSAAIVLKGRDLGQLSPAQREVIESFLANQLPIDDESATKLRSDVRFLLDCLSSDDRDLRASAKVRLSELTGKEINFDPDSDFNARSAAIWKLREQLMPTTRPGK